MTDAKDTNRPVLLIRRCAAFNRTVGVHRLRVEGGDVLVWDNVSHTWTRYHDLGPSAIRRAVRDAARLNRGEHDESHECHFAAM